MAKTEMRLGGRAILEDEIPSLNEFELIVATQNNLDELAPKNQCSSEERSETLNMLLKSFQILKPVGHRPK